MKLSLIDTHCDTAVRLHAHGASLYENDFHVSLKQAEKYENYAHFFAIWADEKRSDDDCFNDFLAVCDNLDAEIDKNAERVSRTRSFADMTDAWEHGKRAIFLACEDARILAGRPERIETLASLGVKYVTLLWGGHTCIGASHDVEGSLTDFGRETVMRCFELGIVPDVSHANKEVTDEVCALAREYGKPIIASHSNCFDVYPHTRNLRREHIKEIISLGGTIGLNLCPYHIKDVEHGSPATVTDILRHAEAFLSFSAEDALGLGCDLDGTDLPEGISGIKDIDRIAEAMLSINYSDELVRKIFWKNDYEFIKKNF